MFPSRQVRAVVLGIMQDGGLPHPGCRCPRCLTAVNGRYPTDYVACLAIVDTRRRPTGVWLIDATPDIKYQLNLLASSLGPHPDLADRLRQPDGIFLTHAHMGHIAGLPQLGFEAMNVGQLPVYASAPFVSLLTTTRLWKPVIDQLQLRTLRPDQPQRLGPGLTITPIPVPHRDEAGVGTFAFLIAGPRKRLLYVPDIDDWSAWDQAREVLTGVDVVLADGSFFNCGELGGRPPVAHPLVPETLKFFADFPGRLVLTHLNHTNPLLDSSSEARQIISAAGVQLAHTGQSFLLSGRSG